MRTFRKKRFIESEGIEVYEKCKEWVDACDGLKVVQGEIVDKSGKFDGYESHRDWEI